MLEHRFIQLKTKLIFSFFFFIFLLFKYPTDTWAFVCRNLTHTPSGDITAGQTITAKVDIFEADGTTPVSNFRPMFHLTPNGFGNNLPRLQTCGTAVNGANSHFEQSLGPIPNFSPTITARGPYRLRVTASGTRADGSCYETLNGASGCSIDTVVLPVIPSSTPTPTVDPNIPPILPTATPNPTARYQCGRFSFQTIPPKPIPPNTREVTIKLFNVDSTHQYRINYKALSCGADGQCTPIFLNKNPDGPITSDGSLSFTIPLSTLSFGGSVTADLSQWRVQAREGDTFIPQTNDCSIETASQLPPDVCAPVEIISSGPNMTGTITARTYFTTFQNYDGPFKFYIRNSDDVIVVDGRIATRTETQPHQWRLEAELGIGGESGPLYSGRTYKVDLQYDDWLPGVKDVGCARVSFAPGSANQNPPGVNPGISSGGAHQVCKALCNQLPAGDLQNRCIDPSGILIDNVPFWQDFGGRIQDPAWQNYLTKLHELINQGRSRGENVEVFKCIDCFVQGNAYTAFGCIETNPQLFIARVFSVSIPIMGGIILLGFLWIGFNTITSGGDPKKMEENKNLATSIIAGALFLLFSVFIYGFIGGTVLGIPGITQ